MEIKLNNIPQEMRERKQWVLWKVSNRDGKPTKVPFSVNGSMAKSNDPTTWSHFETVCEHMDGYAGIGYVFAEDDPYCGIDLDGCRDPLSKTVAGWAKEIIVALDSYTEVSPSETGVKIFIRGKWGMDAGKKAEIPGAPQVCDKAPAIEIYDHVRFFAMTGVRLACNHDIAERQNELDGLLKRFWNTDPKPADTPKYDWRDTHSVIERARSYVARLDAAVSGQGGHPKTFHVACVLCLGFGLGESDAMSLLQEYNQRCDPPWSERELQHKIDSAMQQPGERNYLRNAEPKNYDRIPTPNYKPPEPKPEPLVGTLKAAVGKYLNKLQRGEMNLVETGIPELDYAIGGGAEYGELFLLAARPSHGKSMCGLQMVHHWTKLGIPSAFISQEMSDLALGKRTIQFATDIHQEHWRAKPDQLAMDVNIHFHERAECFIAEKCPQSEMAAEFIRKMSKENGVRCVVVDYAQLLQSKGKGRYEQVTNTSIILRQVANETGVLLVSLCMLGREVEKRDPMIPHCSDLKDSGQLEQDADVIAFIVWPHRVNAKHDPALFQFFVGKNRNREINQPAIECRFEPSRQRILEGKVYREAEEWV